MKFVLFTSFTLCFWSYEWWHGGSLWCTLCLYIFIGIKNSNQRNKATTQTISLSCYCDRMKKTKKLTLPRQISANYRCHKFWLNFEFNISSHHQQKQQQNQQRQQRKKWWTQCDHYSCNWCEIKIQIVLSSIQCKPRRRRRQSSIRIFTLEFV